MFLHYYNSYKYTRRLRWARFPVQSPHIIPIQLQMTHIPSIECHFSYSLISPLCHEICTCIIEMTKFKRIKINLVIIISSLERAKMQLSSVHTTTFIQNCNNLFNSFIYGQQFSQQFF